MQILDNKAWLHRKDGPCWEFSTSKESDGLLVHKTMHGTIYRIFNGVDIGKPFWIGRLHDQSWYTCEKTIRAKKIEFDNGGEYLFPT